MFQNTPYLSHLHSSYTCLQPPNPGALTSPPSSPSSSSMPLGTRGAFLAREAHACLAPSATRVSSVSSVQGGSSRCSVLGACGLLLGWSHCRDLLARGGGGWGGGRDWDQRCHDNPEVAVPVEDALLGEGREPLSQQRPPRAGPSDSPRAYRAQSSHACTLCGHGALLPRRRPFPQDTAPEAGGDGACEPLRAAPGLRSSPRRRCQAGDSRAHTADCRYSGANVYSRLLLTPQNPACLHPPPPPPDTCQSLI